MNKNSVTDSLSSIEFQKEINTLLRTSPKERNGKKDFGWNCRDHALITATIMQMLKIEACVMSGEALYVNVDKRISLEQAPHSWAAGAGIGCFDLSIRFNNSDSSCDWPNFIIAGNKSWPQ